MSPTTAAAPSSLAHETAVHGDLPRLAGWLDAQGRSFLRRMVEVVARPGVRSMAGGLPEAGLFPAELLAETYRDVVGDPYALQYGRAPKQLRDQICELLAPRGIEAEPEQILVTSGAQQGIDIAVRMFLEERGGVLLDEISYTGIHQTAAPRRPHWLEVPVDVTAPRTGEAARDLLRASGDGAADLAYVISSGHNPLGIDLSADQRAVWAETVRDHRLPLIEDDPYGFLGLDGDLPAPIQTLAPERTMYLGSFSKILAPGLRLGYMVVPKALATKAAVVKESTDLETSAITQHVVSRMLATGMLPDHLENIRATYRERRDALLAALDTHFSGLARWTRPRAGMFVWMELDGNAATAGKTDGNAVDTVELLERCVEREGVAFLPGPAFVVPGGRAARRAARSMRLSFSSLDPSQYDDAVAAMARQLAQF